MNRIRAFRTSPLPILLLCGLLLGACVTSARDTRLPAVPLPDGYEAPLPPAVAPAPVASGIGPAPDDPAWWRSFDDPVLDMLVTRSLAGNPGLQEAASRVRESRAIARGIAGADRPTLDLGGSASVQRSQRVGLAAGTGDAGSTSGSAGLGLAFGWLPDLFGGQASATEAAEAEALRQDWLRRQAGLALVAQTAQTYLALRSTQGLRAIAEDSLDLQRQTLALVQGRTEAGLAPELDLARAQAAVAALEAELAPTAAEARRLRNALSVLAGEVPGAPDAFIDPAPEALPLMLSGPPIGLPADLLRRRPDLRAAELALVRATAETGVAEAAFLPTLRLPGDLALSAAGLGTGTIVQTVLAGIGAVLNLPLLDGGQRPAGLDAAQERALQAALAYRATLLAALEEVEAALLAHQGAQAQLAALRVTVDANARAFDQADILYRQGLASFLDVLDAQRALNDSRRRELLAATAVAQAGMNIYAAAGLAPDLQPAEAIPGIADGGALVAESQARR